LSALVAGAVLLEQNLRPGERWRKATRLATSLKREGQQFLQLSGPYFHAGTHDEAYKLFLARLDRIKEQAERPSSGRVWRDFDLRKLSLNEVQEEYLKLRWKGQLDVMRRRAARLRVGRRLVASASVISTAAVPVVLGLESVGAVPFERWVIISTSLVATLVLAIRDVLQPTAELEDMERRSELLETEGWRFFQLTGPYGVYRDREAAFVEFSERIEGILHADPAGTFLADVVTDADGR
jgi:hypothetical protein